MSANKGGRGGLDGGPEKATKAAKPISLQVEYKRLNSFFADYAKNISRGSTFIRTNKPLPLGTQFRFHLKIPGSADPLQLSGVVRARILPGDPEAVSEGPGMAIGFVYGSEAERERIFSAVRERMTESLGGRLYEELVGRHIEASSPERGPE